MPTLDVFRSPGALTVIVTGAAMPPVASVNGGGLVTLRPAHIESHLVAASIIDGGHHPTPGAWWGELPFVEAGNEARLSTAVDGASYQSIVRWLEESAPAPTPAPKRKRRSRLRAV
jgi:hypothetical protein